ncbi:MAG TPA: NFACT family protein [bacterium]|jgi:predicted ribosome quality control (RQC) complex YloA/Tae2 family protein|nr:NFACT family protein [bacterium]
MDHVPPPSFDTLVLAAVAEEITRKHAGGRIGAVVHPDAHTVALRARAGRAGRAIVCSIHPRRARCLLAGLPPGGAPDHPFVLQLRARLEGARLRDARVDPFERVLVLRFETLEGMLALIVEVMGRHSNLLLVEGERILGLFKRVTPSMSRARPLAAGDRYSPPPRGRPTPAEVTADALAGWMSEDAPISEMLVRRLLGVSPPVATHLALRAGLDPLGPAPPGAAERLLEALASLVEVAQSRAFSPLWYADARGGAVAYAAIPLLTYQALTSHPITSMSEAAERVIEAAARSDALEEPRRSLLARIDELARRTQRAEGEVSASIADAGKAAQWRRWGELLLAYASTVPAGADRVTVPDFDGAPVTIHLDRTRGPIATAQAYFRRHAKAAAAGRILPRRLQVLHEEQAYLDQMRLFAAQAATPEEVRAVGAELSGAGDGRPRPRTPSRGARERRRPPEPQPAVRTYATTGGLRILVGRNSRGNEHVTFNLAAPDDLWLHARGMAGAHVILKTDRRTPPPEAVTTAAEVAAYFSEGRSAGKVPVDVTARRHVRKPKGARPGMVTYREERTVMAEPRVPEEGPP